MAGLLAQLSTLLFASNSSDYETTIILISVDGCRPDYLERGVTPTLNELSSHPFFFF